MFLNYISSRQLLPLEMITTAQKFVLLGEQLSQLDNGISLIVKVLNADINTLEGIINRNLGNKFTEDVYLKDKLRDSVFLAFSHYIYAWTNRKDFPEKAKIAEEILEPVQNLGIEFLHSAYSRESVEMERLFKELDKEKYIAKLQKLEAADWYNSLKESQEEFKRSYDKSLSLQAQKDYPLLSEARIQLAQSIETLLNYISLRARTGKQEYKEIMEDVEEILNSVQQRFSIS